jgi:acetyl-CoA C-acetyltransferase
MGVDDVLMANATGPGGNLARRAALDAGCDVGVPGITLDRQCSGGLDAVTMACRLVQAGAGEVYIAGGTESASTSPLRGVDSPDVGTRGRGFFPRRAFSGGGWEDPGMAESAETIASERSISRTRQDTYAAASHAGASAAADDGRLSREIVSVTTASGAITVDTCLRRTLNADRLARMSPVTHAEGTVTAGNASQIADGAAAVLVVSRRVAEAMGDGGLVHRDSASVGVEPRLCGLGAIAAATRLVERNGSFDPAGCVQVAMVEAFASQVCATIDALGLDRDRVNGDGGAIALGHPWGASGAAQVVRLFHALTAGDDGLALAAVAGGMGVAAWFRRERT